MGTTWVMIDSKWQYKISKWEAEVITVRVEKTEPLYARSCCMLNDFHYNLSNSAFAEEDACQDVCIESINRGCKETHAKLVECFAVKRETDFIS